MAPKVQGMLNVDTISVPKHLQIDEASLRRYMEEHVRGFNSKGYEVRKFAYGQSNPTYLIISGGKRYVMRKKPPGKLLPSAHAVEREYRVMTALRGTDVPVPHTYCLCTDNTVIGTPFYIMEFMNGRVFTDPQLTGLRPYEKYAVYSELNRVLAALHTVDFEEVGLGDFGPKSNYCGRQLRRWSKQYYASKTHEVPEMDRLIKYLEGRLSEMEKEDETTIVHGDYRLDNCIFHPTEFRIIAVLDWELCTLGHPLSDLAYVSLMYQLEPSPQGLRGLKGTNVEGVPSEHDFYAAYIRNAGRVSTVKNRRYYSALSLFRFAAIAQGVHKRRVDGNASFSGDIDMAASRGASLHYAKLAWGVIDGDEADRYENLSLPASLLSFEEHFSPKFHHYRKLLLRYMDEYIYPSEKMFEEQHNAQGSDRRWEPPPIQAELKKKAKELGLWNLWLPESRNGAGLTNLEYAYLCEIMGRSEIAPETMNCSAPDTGNMEVLERYGNEEMKERWLKPLLNGEIRSCFAMTERRVGSSDATNIQSSIVRDGDHYVLNGRKWWTSGAPDARCKVAIFMGKTDTGAARHLQQSMVVVPMDTPGVRVLRHLNVFGYDDAPHGHGEVDFKDVRVPASHMLLGEGRGFEISQGRLGPGRIHHCMRSIGAAERALEIMCRRVQNRFVFRDMLAMKDTVLADIANSRIEIEQARLFVLHTAHVMDKHGVEKAQEYISMIKVAVIQMVNTVLDRAIQAHGGMGVCQDTILAKTWANVRTLRFADGPDEVHRMRVGKAELRRAKL